LNALQLIVYKPPLKSKPFSMKKQFTTFALFLIWSKILMATHLGTALPERIKAISKVAYPQEYYAEQAKLWQLETTKNAANPDAWLNYFRAARYTNMLDRNEQPSFDLAAIVSQIPTTLTNTFEYQFIRFMAADWDESRFQFLLKAHELAPQRTEAYHDLVTYHTIKGEQSVALQYLNKLFEAGEFPAELLAWNYNLLASVEQDAILLTYGDNDTYPLWVLQSVRGIRKDVKVLNVNLLLMDEYRTKEFKSLGLSEIDLNGCKSSTEMYAKIMRQIVGTTGQLVYVANTMPEEVRLAFGDSLYLTGLALRYTPISFDNLALLKNNYENRFLLDYLRVDFSPDSITSVMAVMNLQYLPGLVLLHQHYMTSGEAYKAVNLEILMERVAKQGNRMDVLRSYFQGHKTKEEPPVESSISVRTLDKGVKPIPGASNLYAFETEVTNAQYEAFLMDLVKNKEFEQLTACQAPRTNWRSHLPEKFKQLPDNELFKFAHPDDPDCPVVNISHEAAVKYCEWITKVYNASNDKKKTFHKVRFRLPTEAEWMLAAHGGFNAPFPFGNYSPRNDKGCFLGNYDVSNEEPCKDCPTANKGMPDDGAYFPVKADAYFPNSFGLYNTSGNVAEMIAEPGVSKGGSWYEQVKNGTIPEKNTFSKPAPYIGFRVFMDVVVHGNE
jgi:Sulfatase-modifying factor enzyme 1